MAVKVHETGYGKWKVPVIIIAVIVVLSLAGTGILLSDSLGVSIEEGSKRIEVAEGDGTSSVAKLLKSYCNLRNFYLTLWILHTLQV